MLAVKPQVAPQAIPPLAPLVSPSTVVVSIMAGRTLKFLSDALAKPCAIVRAMPNTPAAIGRGITVAVPLHANEAQRALADRLLSATGAVEWTADEALMDAVTAVSGSGPAYVFLLAEALTEAGVAAGLPHELAVKLARETVTGVGRIAAPVAARGRGLARERNVAGRHHRGGPRGPDGARRTCFAHGKGRRRSNQTVARACRLTLRKHLPKRLGTAPCPAYM